MTVCTGTLTHQSASITRGTFLDSWQDAHGLLFVEREKGRIGGFGATRAVGSLRLLNWLEDGRRGRCRDLGKYCSGLGGCGR